MCCPEILDEVSWYISTFNTRSSTTSLPFHSQSYSSNQLISMLRECNSVAFDFNFDNEFQLRCLCLRFE